jgi:hypothetical protein
VIKDVKGVKIGILSIADKASELGPGVDIADPAVSLKLNIKKLKAAKPDLIILLSQLSESKIRQLLKDGLDVDIVISSGATSQRDMAESINSVLLLRSSWLGKYLRRLQFEFEDGKIDPDTFATSEIPLSEKIPDDLDIIKILPRCFSDRDCFKPGLIGTCSNPATSKSECTFKEYTAVPLTIIAPEHCRVCDIPRATSMLKGFFPGVRPSTIKSNTRKAKDLIKKFDIKMLPAYILGKEAKSPKV